MSEFCHECGKQKRFAGSCVSDTCPEYSEAGFKRVPDEPQSTGQKYDDNKPRFHLMPRLAEQEVVCVLTYGAQKYNEHNWRKVKPLNDRYYSAARRHMQAFLNGEQRDKESGHHHLAHAACCVLFMLEHDLECGIPETLKRQAD